MTARPNIDVLAYSGPLHASRQEAINFRDNFRVIDPSTLSLAMDSVYTVAKDGSKRYERIGAAIAQAVEDQTSIQDQKYILVYDGVYEEDLTIPGGIFLIGFGVGANLSGIIIQGRITVNLTATAGMSLIQVAPPTGIGVDIISAVNGVVFFMDNCAVISTDNHAVRANNATAVNANVAFLLCVVLGFLDTVDITNMRMNMLDGNTSNTGGNAALSANADSIIRGNGHNINGFCAINDATAEIDMRYSDFDSGANPAYVFNAAGTVRSQFNDIASGAANYATGAAGTLNSGNNNLTSTATTPAGTLTLVSFPSG